MIIKELFIMSSIITNFTGATKSCLDFFYGILLYEKIFERFYRADESRNRNEKRYGLGLAIAKNIETNHKGKISVNSENGYTTLL